jgi:short-subunit dehydrogenase
MTEKTWALVTGASAGIGLELARVIAADGWKLVLVARRKAKLDELARELMRAHGTETRIVAADLAEQGASQAIFDELRDAGIEVDLLVNNAGLLVQDKFGRADLKEQLDVVRVNVVAHTALARLFLEPMLQRNRGRILNMSSISAYMPVPNLAIYAATKSYVLSFSTALSEELRHTNVTVTAVCPGVTDTGMVHGTGLAGFPSFTVADAGSVARAGYRACMAGKRTYVVGIMNKLLVVAAKYARGLVMRPMGWFIAFNSPNR